MLEARLLCMALDAFYLAKKRFTPDLTQDDNPEDVSARFVHACRAARLHLDMKNLSFDQKDSDFRQNTAAQTMLRKTLLLAAALASLVPDTHGFSHVTPGFTLAQKNVAMRTLQNSYQQPALTLRRPARISRVSTVSASLEIPDRYCARIISLFIPASPPYYSLAWPNKEKNQLLCST
jgi:hypothetical protein